MRAWLDEHGHIDPEAAASVPRPARREAPCPRNPGKPSPLARYSMSPKSSRYGGTIILRIADVAASLTGLVLLLPVLLAVAVFVRVTSPGPALFIQTRVGRRETLFSCFKFRTMTVGAPVAGTHEVSASHVTRAGRILRKTKLDELPQLVNVLLGDMSLVGPRPCLTTQTELIRERRSRGVFDVRPGVTGPAQVQGVDMSTPAKLAELDETWSRQPALDRYLFYVVQTLAGSGRGDRTGA